MNMKELGIINNMPKGWYRGEDQPLWHQKVYHMWKHMWSRVYTELNWFGCLIHPDFKYLSNYVDWIMQEPRFEEFCNTCDKVMWSVDKDMKVPNNRNYYPECMTLTTRIENSEECIKRRGNPNPNIPVIAINSSKVLLFKSTRDARNKGFTQSTVSQCVNKKHKSHKGYKWYKVNYSCNKVYRLKEGDIIERIR